MIALFDVAHVKATRRGATAGRLRRLSGAFQAVPGSSASERLPRLLDVASRKVRNLLVYEGRQTLRRLRNEAKMRAFRTYLDRGWRLPRFLAHLPVDVVLHFAEKEYVIPEPYDGEVVLFRATRKSSAFDGTLVDDTPYRELIDEELLGWEGKTRGGVVVHDVPAGHLSMLQEPTAGFIAERMQRHIDRVLGEIPGPR